MQAYRTYMEELATLLATVTETQGAHIETAATWMAETIADGGIVHLFGSGHSHMIAEEVFHRAGSLMPLNPMLDVNLTFLGSVNATTLERTSGYGKVIVASHDIRPGEAVIVISNSGVNPVPIEVALEARALGARTIAITSDRHYANARSRHASGKRLAEVTDLTIDTCIAAGDALVAVPGTERRSGGASSAVGIAIINAVVAETAAKVAAQGIVPPLIPTMNLPGDGGDEAMENLVATYGARLPLLRHA